jgi:hypothetical protein
MATSSAKAPWVCDIPPRVKKPTLVPFWRLAEEGTSSPVASTSPTASQPMMAPGSLRKAACFHWADT